MATLRRPISWGGGLVLRRAIGSPPRMAWQEETVEILGPVAYEPGMVRVRHKDGRVTRELREYLSP